MDDLHNVDSPSNVNSSRKESFLITIQIPDRSGQPVVIDDKDHESNKRSQRMINLLNCIDYVQSNVLNDIDAVYLNVQSAHQEALLYVFEEKAFIKIIEKKGRSRTRNHRVALDYLIESIWTPRFKIKDIDTKDQLADILTKRNLIRNEWKHLVCWCNNISHFSSIFQQNRSQ